MANDIVRKNGSLRRSVNGVSVEQRRSDGYVNATAMAKAHYEGTGQRRDVSEWLSNARTKSSMAHLSSKTGIPVSQLVESRRGNSKKFTQGTWIHPRLSVRYAIWLSDDFGYLVEEWVSEWMSASKAPTVDLDQEHAQWQQRFDARIELKDVLRPELMNAVVQWAKANNANPQRLCAEVHDLMNQRIQGAKAQQIREVGKLPKPNLIRDYFDVRPLMNYSAINRLAKIAILERSVEPLEAVSEACDLYFGEEYRPAIAPICENVHEQGRRLKSGQRKRRLLRGVQLGLEV